MFIKLLKKLVLAGLLLMPLFVTPTIAVAKNTDNVKKVVDGKINVNKASAKELSSSLKGIGSKKGQAIVDYRNKHGNFTDLKSLKKVEGIGQSLLDKISPHLTL